MTVHIQNKAPPQTTLLTMPYFETGNALDVSYRHQGGKVFVACYNTGISNNDLLDSRPSHFTPLSFRRAVWCVPGLLRWGTSYWAVLCSAGCSNLLRVWPSFCSMLKNCCHIFSRSYLSTSFGRCGPLHILYSSPLVFLIRLCSITFGSMIWMFNLRWLFCFSICTL